MSATVGPGICGRMDGCILTPHLDARPCVFESDLSPAYLRRRPIGVRGRFAQRLGECTCGHDYDSHDVDGCSPACGCGRGYLA